MGGKEEDNENDVTVKEEEDAQLTEPAKKKRKRKRKRKAAAATEDVEDTHDEEPVDEEHKTKIDQLDRTIYVEGIPFHLSVDDVRNFFGQTDKIVECRFPVWQDSGRLRGYGHIVWDSDESYQAALAKSGQYLQKRYLTVEPAKRPKEVVAATTAVDSAPSKTVALHNLSYAAAEDDVQKVMEKFGLIAEGGVRIVRHSASGQSKGFGYVQYEDLVSAKAAVEAAPVRIAGRPCRLDYDHGRVKGSFRMADRKLWQKEYGKK